MVVNSFKSDIEPNQLRAIISVTSDSKDISGIETMSYPAKDVAFKKSNNVWKGEVKEIV